jgi:TonB family protein
VVSCHFDLEGAIKPKPGTSLPPCPQGDLKQEVGPAHGFGGPVDRIVFEERFTLGPQTSPQLGENQMIAGREVFDIDIDATGKLVSCKLADRIGSPAKIDLCMKVKKQYTVRKGADGEPAPFSAVEAFTTIMHVDRIGSPQPDPLNGSLQGLFKPDDYPPNALDHDDQGQVGIVIRTDPKGAISDCVVEETSKSEDLDKQTCDVIRKRAKFKPALNMQGRAVAGEYRARIRWQIEDEITPSDPWAVRTVVNFTSDGRALSCHMEFDGAKALQPGTGPASCDVEAELGAPPKVADLPGAIGTVVMEQRFEIGRVQATPLAPGDFLVGRQVLSLDVDADGKLTSCKVVDIAGADPGSDPCAQVDKQYSLHKGRDEKPAPFNATEIFTIYVRVEKIALGSLSPRERLWAAN